MARLIRKITTNQRGFTLVELVVVIAILGVLAAVATPLLVNYLSGAKAQAYNADVGVIQTGVDAWFTDPANVRFLGKNQYPILGRGETDRSGRTVRTSSFNHPDNGDPFKSPSDDDDKRLKDWNPLGGIQGADLTKSKGSDSGSPAWTDDGDGVREIQKDSPDKWTTVKVTREGVVYYTDSRYYFIDIGALVSAGFLKETPKSSSKDNSSTGAGSYTYYLDDKGRVGTFLFAFPSTANFVAGVYP